MALEELVGEFFALADSGRLQEYGTVQPQSPGLAVPPEAKGAVATALEQALVGVQQMQRNSSLVTFLDGYEALQHAREICGAAQQQYRHADDRYFRRLLAIPKQLLTTLAPAGKRGAIEYADVVAAEIQYTRKNLTSDTPLAVVQTFRQQLGNTLQQYRRLQNIGIALGVRVHHRAVEKYAKHLAAVDHVYRTEFLPLRAEYLAGEWRSPESLTPFQKSLERIADQFGPRGIFRRDYFPEYVGEVHRFKQELDFHTHHHADVQRWAKRLRLGLALSSSCPDEFRQLRYLAPMLEEAAKRESEAAQREPQSPPLAEPSGSFPSLPLPPKTVHPQLGTAYGYLTHPIGWMGRLEKFANSLTKIQTEACAPVDLQYCISLRSYLQAVGSTPLFATSRNQFPTLEQNYLRGMAQLERLCAL